MSHQIKAARHYGRGAMGDPGLFGFLGKVAKGIGGAVTGAARGLGLLPQQQSQIGGLPRGTTGGFAGPQQAPGRIGGGITFNPPFGGPPGVGMGGFFQAAPPRGAPRNGRQGVPQGFKLACPSGFHPNKSDYFTKSEGFIPEGTKCVKNRRRNPANPRALDRALSRLNMAKRLQNKLSGYATDKYTRGGKKRD